MIRGVFLSFFFLPFEVHPSFGHFALLQDVSFAVFLVQLVYLQTRCNAFKLADPVTIVLSHSKQDESIKTNNTIQTNTIIDIIKSINWFIQFKLRIHFFFILKQKLIFFQAKKAASSICLGDPKWWCVVDKNKSNNKQKIIEGIPKTTDTAADSHWEQLLKHYYNLSSL